MAQLQQQQHHHHQHRHRHHHRHRRNQHGVPQTQQVHQPRVFGWQPQRVVFSECKPQQQEKGSLQIKLEYWDTACSAEKDYLYKH